MNKYIVKQANHTGDTRWWIYKADGVTLSYKNGSPDLEVVLNLIKQCQPEAEVEVQHV